MRYVRAIVHGVIMFIFIVIYLSWQSTIVPETQFKEKQSQEIKSSKEIEWNGDKRLTVSNIVGNIKVHHWSKNKILIETVKIVDNIDCKQNKDLFTMLDYTITSVAGTTKISTVGLSDMLTYPAQLDYDIFLPKEIQSINVYNDIGNIQVEGEKYKYLNLVTKMGNIGSIFEGDIEERHGYYSYKTDRGDIIAYVPYGTNIKTHRKVLGVNVKRDGKDLNFYMSSGGFGHSYIYGYSNDELLQERILTTEQMKEDMDLLVSTLKDSHPTLKQGFSQNQKQIINDIYKKINEPVTLDEFYFLLNYLVITLKDGHTELRCFSQQVIDFPVVWLKEGLIINKNTDLFRIGDKVLMIGEKTEPELLEDMKDLISSENVYRVKSQGEHRIDEELYLRHLGLVEEDDIVNVEVERDGKRISLTVPLYRNALKYEDIFKDNPRKWFWWEIDEENKIAMYHVKYFIYTDNYNKYIQEFFKEVSNHQIGNIVFDVGENLGGSSDAIQHIFEYINVDRYYTYRSKDEQKMINNQNVDDGLFKGNVYTLTSYKSFSGATVLALIGKDNGIAKIIGEPTSNATAMYGNSEYIQLINSEFILKYATITGKRPSNEEPEIEIEPDIEINYTLADVIQGRKHYYDKVRKAILLDIKNRYRY